MATMRSWPWCEVLQCGLICRTDAGWDCQETYRIVAIKIKAAPRYHLQRFAPSCTRLPRQTAFLAVSSLPLRERVENSHACGREVVDVPRDNHKIVNQCGRRNLLVQRILGVRHTKPTPDVGHLFI